MQRLHDEMIEMSLICIKNDISTAFEKLNDIAMADLTS